MFFQDTVLISTLCKTFSDWEFRINKSHINSITVNEMKLFHIDQFYLKTKLHYVIYITLCIIITVQKFERSDWSNRMQLNR